MASSFSFERRMLKDFLEDELPSCSSNDTKSRNPRKPCKLRARSFSTPNKTPSQQLIRSRSKAASISISAVHRASDIVINAIKFFPFATMKTPAILPRSISRKLSRRNKEDRNNAVLDAVSVKVKIKDILRWKSFRDVAMELEEMPLPTSLDFSSSPDQCTTITRFTTGSSSTDSTSSKRSSWCGSDFTVEDLSSYCSEDKVCMNEDGVEFGKHYLQEGPKKTMGTSSKREPRFDEDDQHSPVSVLDSPFREDQEFFHRSLATVQRRKCRLMQRIQEFESLANFEPIKNLEREYFPTEEDNSSLFEEDEDKNINDELHKKARQLLGYVKRKRSGKNVEATNSDHDHLLLDFFIQELAIGSKLLEQNDAKFDCEMLRLAESWLSKGCSGSLDWEMLGNREECIRDMEKGLRWNSFEEEQQELGCKLEMEVLNDLLDEILADLDR